MIPFGLPQVEGLAAALTEGPLNDTTIVCVLLVQPLASFTVTVNLDCIKDYHPNMIAIMKIIDYSNPKAFVIPVNMIQKTEEGDFVFIAENNKAKKARVKTGKAYNGSAEILDGLKDGDKLITKGFQELNEGEMIKY